MQATTSEPPPFEVEETPDGVVYRLRRSSNPALHRGGLGMALFSGSVLLLAVLAIGLILFGGVRNLVPPAALDFIPRIVTVVLLSMLLLASVRGIGLGLALALGRDELRIIRDRLATMQILGPFRWSRKVRIASIRGLTIVLAPVLPLRDRVRESAGKLAALEVQIEKRRPATLLRGYPPERIRAIADVVACRLQELRVAEPGLAGPPGTVRIDERSDDPREIVERTEQPADSRVNVERTASSLKIAIPPRGWRGLSNLLQRFLVFWGIVLALAIAAVFLPSAIPGQAPGAGIRRPPYLLKLFPIFAVFLMGLILAVENARRWAMFTASRSGLEVVGRKWFRRYQKKWTRDELKAIRVGAEPRKGRGPNTVWVNSLVIEPVAGPPVSLLHDLPRAELEWLATLLRHTIGKPSE